MSKVLFTLNPNAGKGKAQTEGKIVKDALTAKGYDVTVYMTKNKGDLIQMLRADANAYEFICVYGGDGTLNEAVNGLVGAGYKGKVGYIPKGTVNDFATTLSIPKNIHSAAKNVCGDNFTPCDICSVNGRYYTYVSAFGAFCEVSYATPQKLKKIMSKLAYIAEGIRSIPKIKPIRSKVTYNGKTVEGDYLYGMVSNTKCVGSFKFPGLKADINDGMLELMLIKKPSSLFGLLGIAFSLMSKNIKNKNIVFEKTDVAFFEFEDPPYWTVDGECGDNERFVEIKCHKSAINIAVP